MTLLGGLRGEAQVRDVSGGDSLEWWVVTLPHGGESEQ